MTGSVRNSVLLLLLCFGSATAWAKKRVVVLTFEGQGADALQEVVVEVMRKDATVVSDAAFRRAMTKLKVKKLTEAGYAKVAADVQADAIVAGTLGHTGKKWKLTLVVREGKSGEMAATVVVPLKSGTPDDHTKTDIAAQLGPVIASTASISGEEVVEETTAKPPQPVATKPPPKPPGVETRPPVVVKTPPPKPPQPVVETPPPVEVAKADPPPETTVETPPSENPTTGVEANDLFSERYARNAPFDIELAGTVSVRSMSFDLASTLTNAQKPNGYKGSTVPSAGLEGEIYPFVLTNKPQPLIAGLGFAFDVDRVFLLQSRLGSNTYDTSQMRYGGGLRWRINLGNTANQPTIKFILGWEHLDFTIDRGPDNIDLPNVAYEYIETGARFRVPVGRYFAFHAEGRYLIVLSTGEIGDSQQYGGGGALALSADAGVELRPTPRNLIRAGFRYQTFQLSFDGSGYLARNRDSDPSTKDVFGATDTFLAGYLSYGYLF